MRKTLPIALAVAIVVRTSGTLAADAPPPAWQGVWEGTLGSQPIRACFSYSDYRSFGFYYYQAHLDAIPLQQPKGQPRKFVEGPNEDDVKSPFWELGNASRAELTAQWKQGTRSLPIHLRRLAGPEFKEGEDQPCSGMLFQGPRLEGIRIVRAPAVKDGVRYVRLTLDHRGHFGSADDVKVESFALIGDRPQYRRINAKLHEILDSGYEYGWFSCVKDAAAGGPYGGGTNEGYEPTLFSGRWLAVKHHYEGYCGGAHPDSWTTPLTFDLQTGAEVDPLYWLMPKAVHREDLGKKYGIYKTLTPAFVAVILNGWKGEDPECDEATRTQEAWNVGIARGALVFSPDLPHADAACVDDYKVSFARLQPWLNAKGKAAIATLPR